MKNPLLIVLTGKTASGKDTIASKLPNFKRVITTTSRSPRRSEINGKDYLFLTKQEFENKIKQGEFFEYVTYGGNLYGTFKKELEQSGDLLWRIDPSRAGQIKNVLQDALVIYITCDDEVILQRLKKRGLKDTEIQKRMSDDTKIWQQYKDKYDFVIENVPGKLDDTISKVCQIIISNYIQDL